MRSCSSMAPKARSAGGLLVSLPEARSAGGSRSGLEATLRRRRLVNLAQTLVGARRRPMRWRAALFEGGAGGD